MVKGNIRGSRKKRKGGRRTKSWRLDPLRKETEADGIEISLPPVAEMKAEDLYVITEVKPLWVIRLWRWIKSLFVK
jgi:hypothetical protein